MNDNIFINKKLWNTFTESEMNDFIDSIFSYYRKTGFPYYSTDKAIRDSEFNKLRNYNCNDIVIREDDTILFKQVMHGLSLAWSYFPHSWNIPCNGMKTPMQAFLDDDTFKKVIIKRTKMGDNMSDAGIRKVLRIYSGVQCVSNFRPTTACAIYNLFASKGTVLDMSSGFGGRLLGFIISNADSYIGLEPSVKTYEGLLNIKKDYGMNKNISLFNVGSEDYLPEKESLDFCFTSPPYYNTEKYSEEPTQSCIKYPTKDLWINDFLKKTFQNCYYGLKPNKYMAINIANVKSFKNLEEKTVQVAQKVGFKLENTYYYLLSSLSHKTKFKSEPIFIFKK